MPDLRGKTVKGIGMELGRALFFFDDGTMATVGVEPRRKGELPRDVILAVTSWEEDSDHDEQLARANPLHVAADEVIADLCALAEAQPGNPHDELSEQLYEIAHKLELAERRDA